MPVEALLLACDPEGFLRRECPHCKRQFKVRYTPEDAQGVQRRLSVMVEHQNDHEVPGWSADRHCPYCGHHAAEDEWFTAEQRCFLEKKAERFTQEIRYEQLAHVERTLADNPYLTFLAVRPRGQAAPLTPELNDMRLVPLLCCGEEVKVGEFWPGAVHCPYCGVEHVMGDALVRPQLPSSPGA